MQPIDLCRAQTGHARCSGWILGGSCFLGPDLSSWCVRARVRVLDATHSVSQDNVRHLVSQDKGELVDICHRVQHSTKHEHLLIRYDYR